MSEHPEPNSLENASWRPHADEVINDSLSLAEDELPITVERYIPRQHGEVLSMPDLVKLYTDAMENEGSSSAEMLDEQSGKFTPKRRITVADKEFFVGRVLTMGDYKVSVAYIRGAEGKVIPRLFYKSHSSGDWRATPGLIKKEFIKSPNLDDTTGEYVQMTKPVLELREALEAEDSRDRPKETSIDEINDLFKITRQLKEGSVSFESEIITETLPADSAKQRAALYDTYAPGRGLTVDRDVAQERLEGDSCDSLMPDVRGVPQREYTYRHDMAGDVTVREFKSARGSAEYIWAFCEDIQGNVWVDQVRRVGSQVTTYGTETRVVVAGPYSAKPFEYRSQIQGLEAGDDYASVENSRYVDIRPFLQKLRLVQLYKQQRGTLAS